MKKYGNKYVNEEFFGELEEIRKDFDRYCKDNDFSYSEKKVKNFVCECGKVYYIECDGEKGVAVWWNIEDELVAYILPDSMNFNLETGELYSDSEFTLFDINKE